MKKRVLSGIRATGRLHLGNYLGAVKGMLNLQADKEFDTFFMVADVHTITTPYDVEQLRKNRREVILDYLAAGLDPKKSVIFQQSEVSEHLELAFYLSSIVTVGKMQHLPTFKEKVKQYPQHSTMALLNYPVLMAADILLYKGEEVPVGIDQEPHLEVTREIARRFNQVYKTSFPEPERFKTDGEYVPSLTGNGKMSKSVTGSYINLTDDFKTINKKIRSIPTATEVGGEKSSGVKALFEFLKIYDPNSIDDFETKFKEGSLKYVELKDYISDLIYKDLKPIQEKRQEFERNPKKVDKIISEGNKKAKKEAEKTLIEVKEKMGLH